MKVVPVTVLTGFLGSGKTTLLNQLLHGDHGLKLAVIVNEFGQVGIDGAAVAGGEQFVELDNGCLCCAINEDLQQTLKDLRARGGFDQMVIETTGLADPLPVAWTFSKPGLSDYYRVDAIVCLVDAKNCQRALEKSPEAREQIERADILVLNKLDLVEDEGQAAEAVVRRLNPDAVLLRATQGDVPWSLLLTVDTPSRIISLAGGESLLHRGHKPSFQSWVYQTDATLSDAAVEDLLFELPEAVYRVKGLLRTDEAWRWTLVNGVAGRFDMRPIQPEPEPERSALVFIGPQLDTQELARRCQALEV